MSLHVIYEVTPYYGVVIGGFVLNMFLLVVEWFVSSSITLDRLKQVEPERYDEAIEYYKQLQQPIPLRLHFNKGL